MTKDQRKYAKGRINSLVSQEKERLREKHTTPEKTLSVEEKAELLLSGEVKADDLKQGYRGGVTFEVEAWPGEHDEQFDEESFEAEMQPIRSKAQEIKDRVVLGDSERALEGISELEEMIGA